MTLPPPPPPPGAARPPQGDPFRPPHAAGPGQYPGQGFSSGPPQWQQQPPPRNRGNGWKWVLGGVALLAVIGVTAAITLSVAGNGNGPSSPSAAPQSASASNSDIASANDTGPVAVITDDASCAPAGPILEMRSAQQRNGWDKRDPSIPATGWNPEVRAQYEAIGESMRSSADQLVPIAKLTPHRVMRELYGQLIAYSRAYADSIPTYTPPADRLVIAAAASADAISRICAAISYGSAAARAPLIPPLGEPSQVGPVGDPANPRRFLTNPNVVCGDWGGTLSQFQTDTKAWAATSPDVPASQWTPEQKTINSEVAPVMNRLASQLQALGERSGDPTLRDFADLSAQYRRAYVEALPTYTPADDYLATAALRISGLVQAACEAAGE